MSQNESGLIPIDSEYTHYIYHCHPCNITYKCLRTLGQYQMSCQKCKQAIFRSAEGIHDRYLEHNLKQNIEKLLTMLNTLQEKFDKLDQRLGRIEYAPPDGPEFLDIMNEAKEHGDFS